MKSPASAGRKNRKRIDKNIKTLCALAQKLEEKYHTPPHLPVVGMCRHRLEETTALVEKIAQTYADIVAVDGAEVKKEHELYLLRWRLSAANHRCALATLVARETGASNLSVAEKRDAVLKVISEFENASRLIEKIDSSGRARFLKLNSRKFADLYAKKIRMWKERLPKTVH